jgi:hypothetical protein
LAIGRHDGSNLPLLIQSRRVEQASIGHGGAIHSSFAFQTLSQDGKILESQKVDSWRSLTPNRTALRLLDNKGRVIAGKWTDTKGKITTYNPSAGLRRDSKPGVSGAWELVPGGETLAVLTTTENESQVRRRGEGYEIQYERHQPPSNFYVMSAALELESPSLRPVSEDATIVEEGKTREYRFRRLTYEVVRADQVLDSDFTPPSNFANLRPGPFGSTDADGHTAHLILEALQLLSNLGPDVEQIVDLERMPNGEVEVNGVFPTVEQKVSVLRVFEPLRGDGEVRFALHSGDEPRTSSDRRTPIQVESLSPVDVESERILFDAQLRSALTAQGLSGHEIDDRIRDLASESIRHSARMHREAWSICQIAAHDFIGNELQSMAPEDKMLWLTLLDKHIRSFEAELNVLHSNLKPLMDENARLLATKANISAVHNTNELGTIAHALNQNAEQLDRMLTAGLTLSPQGPPAGQNSETITPLFATLRTEETMLHGTIERLQTFGHAEVNK